jgi:hypothetical protein
MNQLIMALAAEYYNAERGIKSANAFDPVAFHTVGAGAFRDHLVGTGEFTYNMVTKAASEHPNDFNDAYQTFLNTYIVPAAQKIASEQILGENIGYHVFNTMMKLAESTTPAAPEAAKAEAAGFLSRMRAAAGGYADKAKGMAGEHYDKAKGALSESWKASKAGTIAKGVGAATIGAGALYGAYRGGKALHNKLKEYRAAKAQNAAANGAPPPAHTASDPLLDEAVVGRSLMLIDQLEATGRIDDYMPVSELDRDIQNDAMGTLYFSGLIQ